MFVLQNVFIMPHPRQQKNRMIYSSTTIIDNYLSEELLPLLWKAILTKQSEKRVQRHMPHIVSNHMLIDLLDSTTKNSCLLERTQLDSQITSARQPITPCEAVKAPIKKIGAGESGYLTIHDSSHKQKQQNQAFQPQMSSVNNLLIPLPTIKDQQSLEVKQLRIKKEKVRKFQKQIGRKKSVHRQYKYHTYDYQTNIVPVDMEKYYEKGAQVNESLLECLKKTLDKQIQDDKINKKLSQLNRKRINCNISQNKIQKIQSNNSMLSSLTHVQSQNYPLKPSQKFQLSYVTSLSQEFQKCMQSGVKMITNQQKIVQQYQNPQGSRFLVKRQKKVHEKSFSSPKQKTLSSQSIIYSLEKKTKHSNAKDNTSNHSDHSDSIKKYQSLQVEKEGNSSKLSEYCVGIQSYKQIKSTINTPSIYDFKLPEIKFSPQIRKMQQKRTATKQKMIKGLDHIQIQIKFAKQRQNMYAKQKSRLFVAFSGNKKSESSLDQVQHDKYSIKKKKSLIKDYFNNYGNQFRLKQEGALNQINIHS